jgi:subtilisin family serine protease
MSIRSIRRGIHAWSALVVVATAGWPGPAVAADTQAGEYNWYATHKNSPEGIAFDIALLYDELYDRKLLPKREYTDPDGKPVSEIMREQKHFVGGSFPLVLDRLLCRLNPRACRAVTEPGDPPPRFVWFGKPGTTYTLPNVVFDEYRSSVAYDKRRGESVPDIVVHKLQGCRTFDDACRRAIANLNRRVENPLDPNYEGRLVLPSLGVRAYVPNLEQLERTAVQRPTRKPNAPVDQTLEKKLRDANQAGQKLDRQDRGQYIQKNIPSPTPYKLQTSHTIEDFHFRPHQERLFNLIGHPLMEGPLERQQFRNRVVVGVLDGRVDPSHCDLQGRDGDLVVRNRPSAPAAAGGPPECSGIEEQPTLQDNHGTHVTGLIGAKLDGRGIVGINPLSHIVTYEVSLNAVDDVALIEEAIQDRGARVINISMSRLSDPGNDPIEGAIDRQSDVLFVIAAGNDGENMTKKCRAFPACYEYPNVISVVALNDDQSVPDVWRPGAGAAKGSNYGTKFHVAAPGAHILSTISSGRWGYFSGTSQAAPMVTGAASLLLMKKATLSPERIKERLIVSADVFTSLAEKVRGGRLNIKRALDFERDVIVRPSGMTRGKLVRTGTLAVVTSSGRPLEVPWSEVRRLVKTGDGVFAVMRATEREGRREIDREFNVRLFNPAASVDVLTPTSTQLLPIPVGEIIDFTARLEE